MKILLWIVGIYAALYLLAVLSLASLKKLCYGKFSFRYCWFPALYFFPIGILAPILLLVVLFDLATEAVDPSIEHKRRK